MSFAQNFINSFDRMPNPKSTGILPDFQIKEDNAINLSNEEIPKMAKFSFHSEPISNSISIPFSNFNYQSSSVQNELNPFDEIFGFKLEIPSYKNTTGYNPLEGYSQKRYMIETLQNEAGEQNNLSRIMDEYESAQAEFMAKALDLEADKLNDTVAVLNDEEGISRTKRMTENFNKTQSAKKREQADKHREKAQNVKIGSAFHNIPVKEQEEPIPPELRNDFLRRLDNELEKFINEGKQPGLEFFKNLNNGLKEINVKPLPRTTKPENIVQALRERFNSTEFKNLMSKNTKKKFVNTVLSELNKGENPILRDQVKNIKNDENLRKFQKAARSKLSKRKEEMGEFDENIDFDEEIRKIDEELERLKRGKESKIIDITEESKIHMSPEHAAFRRNQERTRKREMESNVDPDLEPAKEKYGIVTSKRPSKIPVKTQPKPHEMDPKTSHALEYKPKKSATGGGFAVGEEEYDPDSDDDEEIGLSRTKRMGGTDSSIEEIQKIETLNEPVEEKVKRIKSFLYNYRTKTGNNNFNNMKEDYKNIIIQKLTNILGYANFAKDFNNLFKILDEIISESKTAITKKNKKSATISEDTPGKLYVGGGGNIGEDIRSGSKTSGKTRSTSGRSYTPLKSLQKLLDTVPQANLSESDYSAKISEIEDFESKIKNKTGNYYDNKTQLKSILDDKIANSYITNFNKLLKSLEIREKITSSTNVNRTKGLLEQVKAIYVSRRELRPTTTTTTTAQSTPKNTPSSKKKGGP